MSAPIPVLVVDDSPFMRIALRRIIEADGDLRVIGEVGDGEAAVGAVREHHPAVVVMDVEMPRLCGIEATRRIMALPDPPAVVMVSQHTQDQSPAAIAAIAAGASDYLSKETGLGGVDLAHLDRALRERLRHWARAARGGAQGSPAPATSRAAVEAPPPLVLVAASTGGPDALALLLEACGPLPVPMVIAQHMPEGLAAELAAQLARRAGWPVRVAASEHRLAPGEALLLPTDGVLLRRVGALWLRLAPSEAPVHPSADLLFRSAALLGLPACALVLTGMGEDGALGAAALAAQGGRVFVQSTDTAVVGGMPEATRRRVPGAEAFSPSVLGTRLRRLWRQG